MNSLELASRNNNFGALRLLFAILVILSHSFELVDGNRSRELLTRIFRDDIVWSVGFNDFFDPAAISLPKAFRNLVRLDNMSSRGFCESIQGT